MTEAEWLACEDPWGMLCVVNGKVNDRRLRLFMVACCQPIRHLLPNEEIRRAVIVAERFSDGEASEAELSVSYEYARAADDALSNLLENPANYITWAANNDVELATESSAFGSAGVMAHEYSVPPEVAATWNVLWPRKPEHTLAYLRDVLGNPFRPAAFSQEWRTDTAVALASQMYESRDFSAMPLLADALQDAGCDNDDILTHCRSAGPHVRGCWVVDLVLGKG